MNFTSKAKLLLIPFIFGVFVASAISADRGQLLDEKEVEWSYEDDYGNIYEKQIEEDHNPVTPDQVTPDEDEN